MLFFITHINTFSFFFNFLDFHGGDILTMINITGWWLVSESSKSENHYQKEMKDGLKQFIH
jgi:hypothetical protein